MKFKKIHLVLLTTLVTGVAMAASQLGRNTSITWPDLGDAGGAGQVTTIQNSVTELSNDDNSRYRTASAVADSTLTTFTHDFGVAFSELNVLLYTGTHPSLTRVSDPAAAGWTIAANGGNPLTQIDVTTPGSGGPHTFALQIIQGRGAENLDDLDDVDVSTTAPEDGQALVFDSTGSEWIPGASGDSSFKCQTVSDPNLTLKSGFLILDDGVELRIATDLTVSLDTILGSDPANATTYYLYIDLENTPAAALLANGRQARTVSAAGHFSLQTNLPDTVLQSRYVPICFIRSADSGTVWSGTGSDFDTLATRRHGRPVVNVSPTVYELSKQTVGSVGSSGQVNAGHILADESFPAFTTEISYYNLGDVNDDSGNARTLTNEGSTVFTGTDILGNASSTADLDGVDDNLTDDDALYEVDPSATDFAWGAWYAADDWTPASDEYMFTWTNSSTAMFQVSLQDFDGVIRLQNSATVGSTVEFDFQPPVAFVDGSWHHFAVTNDASEGVVTFYVDGVPVGSFDNGDYGSVTTGPTRVRWGANVFASAANFFDGRIDEAFISTGVDVSSADIRKLYSYRIDRTDAITVENQQWYATFFDANDEIINELDQDWLVSKTDTDAYIDLGLSSTDSVALRMQNQSFNTTNVPIKTFTTGLQSSDPGTQTHNLGCTPKDFYVLHEGASLSGDFDKRYDLCSADATSITCDLSSLTIDATHRVEIVGSCVPVAISVPSADATTTGTVTTSAQTFAGAKTFSAVSDFSSGVTLPTTGGTQATLDHYEEFTTSYAPTAGTQTVQVRAVRVGKLVTVTAWFSVVDTGVDSGNSSGSILPTTMYPPRKISTYHLQRDPTVAGSPCVRYSIEDAGEIRLQTASCADIGAGGGNWSGAMTSETVGVSMSYTLDF